MIDFSCHARGLEILAFPCDQFGHQEQHLRAQRKGVFGDAIKWNFTKFLVDRNGEVVQRYASTTNPCELAQEIGRLL